MLTSGMESHGKHALRRRANELRSELARDELELRTLEAKIDSLLWKASEVDHSIANVQSMGFNLGTRSESPKASKMSPRSQFGSEQVGGSRSGPLSSRRAQEWMVLKQQRRVELAKSIARKQTQLEALQSRLEFYENTSRELNTLFRVQKSQDKSSPSSPRSPSTYFTETQFESELRYVKRQQRARALQPAARARLKMSKQKAFLEMFDDQASNEICYSSYMDFSLVLPPLSAATISAGYRPDA